MITSSAFSWSMVCLRYLHVKLILKSELTLNLASLTLCYSFLLDGETASLLKWDLRKGVSKLIVKGKAMSQHMLGNIRGVCHESLGFIEKTSSLFTSMPPTSAAEGTPEIINPFTALHGCLSLLQRGIQGGKRAWKQTRSLCELSLFKVKFWEQKRRQLFTSRLSLALPSVSYKTS